MACIGVDVADRGWGGNVGGGTWAGPRTGGE